MIYFRTTSLFRLAREKQRWSNRQKGYEPSITLPTLSFYHLPKICVRYYSDGLSLYTHFNRVTGHVDSQTLSVESVLVEIFSFSHRSELLCAARRQRQSTRQL